MTRILPLRPRGAAEGEVMFKKLIDRFIERWMLRCVHDSGNVTADVLEGELRGAPAIQHCKRCGAVRIVRDGKAGSWRNAWPTDNP